MRALVLLRKDIRTVLRNKRELAWMILVPFLLLAANFYLQDQSVEIKVGLVGDTSLIPDLQERVKAAELSQIKLITWRFSEPEAQRRLEQGMINAYLVFSADQIDMYANLADTSGAVAQAFFTDMVRDINAQMAEKKLTKLVDDPATILAPIRWQVTAAGKQVNSAVQLIFSSLFVIMGVITALSLGQQSISMERHKNTLVSLRKSPLSDRQIIWAKLGAGWFTTLLPLAAIIGLIAFVMPEEFLRDPDFYLIMLAITFNSVALGVLIGAYVRGANEANGIRFMLTLPAMFMASLPVTLPSWLERTTGAIPTLVSAQLVRSYMIAGQPPRFGAVAYLVLTGLVSIQIASACLGREE